LISLSLPSKFNPQNLSHMATAHYTPTHCPDTGRKFTRAERKAANKARFKAEMAASSPKPKRKGKRVERKGQLVVTHHGDALNTRVYTLAPKRKATKASLMRLTKAELVDMLMGKQAGKPEPASKRKAKSVKAKARKATPQERTADKQERAAHGPKGVGPITPQPKAAKADVAKARKAGKAQGERNRTERAKRLATQWAFDATYGGMFIPTQQAELKRLLGDVEVSTYEDVMAASL
jgi:hypothetical protein